MLSTVHGLEQFLAHLHGASVLVSDRDHIRDVEHSHVAGHGQELAHGELGQIPLGSSPLLELLGDRTGRFDRLIDWLFGLFLSLCGGFGSFSFLRLLYHFGYFSCLIVCF